MNNKMGCFSIVSGLILVCTLLAMLAACLPSATPSVQPTAVPATPLGAGNPTQMPATAPVVTATPLVVVSPTQAPVQPTLSSSNGLSLDLAGLAQGMNVETKSAVLPSAGGPAWEALPEHRVATLQGYRVSAHAIKPQVFLYPAGQLAGFTPAAGKMLADLQALLQTQKPGDALPYLPLNDSMKKLQAQVQLIDFKNGKGVRYLTQFDQGPMLINNTQVVYTFQGLSSDGKTYVAVVLPVTHPELSASADVFSKNSADLPNYPAYVTKTAELLNQKAGSTFNPDLAKLDALVRSIEVK